MFAAAFSLLLRPPCQRINTAATAIQNAPHSENQASEFLIILSLGMRFVVNLDQFFHRNVSVNLGGGEPRVAQQFLNVAQVGAAVEQMRGKGMTQRVRA